VLPCAHGSQVSAFTGIARAGLMTADGRGIYNMGGPSGLKLLSLLIF
jgi:hypothetical protein